MCVHTKDLALVKSHLKTKKLAFEKVMFGLVNYLFSNTDWVALI